MIKQPDKKHIPKELTEAVNALLYNINLESNYTYELKDDYVYNEKEVDFFSQFEKRIKLF